LIRLTDIETTGIGPAGDASIEIVSIEMVRGVTHAKGLRLQALPNGRVRRSRAQHPAGRER